MTISLILDVVTGALLLGGCVLVISGGVGLLRFPDFYSRTHAASLTDTAGAGLVILGLLLQADGPESVIRLVLIMFFMMLTGPTAAHALAQAARRDGERAVLDGRAAEGPADGPAADGPAADDEGRP
ncbi:monovalent cation/H(+) antiporter subunit G [Actinomadura sp. WMMB 499]|uniref:monovalent cation/H(+) antiporter subunit G n=1 Tax=Actinomadura sp. WMMB 499 TaxID=1219491 RepID=UPI001C3F8130|nr:monovalent cation/H(+) antiporter subunit G [Actinomadura sp. WMMB 499]